MAVTESNISKLDDTLTKIQDLKEETLTPIQKFFHNTNVFITGGTGFLGVLLLEKLLLSCPISKIYLLVRNKKGKNVQERLDELFEGVVFSRLREKCSNFREKIIPVEGDCELPGLALSTQDQTVLTQEVDVVFHVAATVRFDENLKKASFINVRAVRDLVHLAHRMPNLKSFVHISTAFSNCINSYIKEEFYPPSIDYNQLLNITEALSEDIVTIITPQLLGNFPNTYSYTKQIGEDVIKQEGQGLPIAVHRPSIVISTYKEPVEGWTNNFYGPTGMVVGTGVGLIRALNINPEVTGNMVPADMVINSIIGAAWDVAQNFATQSNMPIYNFEASQCPENLTWGDFTKKCSAYGFRYYPTKGLWYIFSIAFVSDLPYRIGAFFLHTLPALLIDGGRICVGKRPMMMKIYNKIDKMSSVLRYFSRNCWEFESENSQGLVSRMSAEDSRIFFCDLKQFKWDKYLESFVIGCRIYLVKDPLETVPLGQKIRRRAYILHLFTVAVLVIFLLWMVWQFFCLIFKVIQ